MLEATGGFELPVLAALGSAGLPVVAVNPRQVRDFAKATGKLAKTDAIDARVLAHFADAVRPAVRPLPDAATLALGALVTRRRQLVEMLTAEENRHKTASTVIRADIQDAHRVGCANVLKDVDEELSQAIRSARCGASRRICYAVCSALALVVSVMPLADMPELGTLDRKQNRPVPPAPGPRRHWLGDVETHAGHA